MLNSYVKMLSIVNVKLFGLMSQSLKQEFFKDSW